MRIVSLLPSATEIVYALGVDDQLVGVTFECNEPARARLEKAVVVGGRDTTGLTPGQIDAYVRTQAAAGEDLYHLHRDALAGLDPDLVLTQDLCWVCALPSATVSDALEHLGCRADVLALDPYSLEDVLATIGQVGAATGSAERAAGVVTELRARLGRVAHAVAGRRRPRVAVVEWIDPPFPGGHWIPDLVAAAGGEPVGGLGGQRSHAVSWDDLAACAPDVLVVAPCGFGLDGALEQAGAVCDALAGPTVWAIDADSFVVRPGPRVVDGVEVLASALHPGAVPARPDAIRQVRA